MDQQMLNKWVVEEVRMAVMNEDVCLIHLALVLMSTGEAQKKWKQIHDLG